VPDWKETLAQYDADHDGRISLAESPMKNPTTFMEADLNRDGYLDERDWNFYRARRTSQNNVVAIRGGGHGDVTNTHVLWRYRKAVPNVPSPLLYKGVMYLMKEGGIFTSVNPKNGEIYKQARLTGALGQYWSSPVATDGKIYVASEDGKVTVISAAAEWEILAINEFDEDIFATPAIAGESIYLRTRGTLYRFGR
jgi:outer membrane protein assembly factor BamB